MTLTRKVRRACALILLLLVTGALGVFVVTMLPRSVGNGPAFLANTNGGGQSDRVTRNDREQSAEIANDKAPSSNGNKEKELEPGDPPGIPHPAHSASSKPRSGSVETTPHVASRGTGSAGTGSGSAGSGGPGGASGGGGVPQTGNSGGGSRFSGERGFGGGGFSVPPGPAGTPGTVGPASGTPAATPPSALTPIASSAGPSPSSTPAQINPMPLPQAGPAPIVTPPTGQFTPQAGPASAAPPPTDTSPPPPLTQLASVPSGPASVPGPIVTTMIGDGILRPGHSPGTATISDLSGHPIGLEIEIAGTAADQFDVVIITGPTAIFPEGYTISFILLGDYVPTSGADFEFLLANGVEGEENILFSLIKPASTILTSGFGYQVYVDDESDMHVRFYDANSPLEGYVQDRYTGEVSIVPEPSSIALALLGLSAIGWRFRRRVVPTPQPAAPFQAHCVTHLARSGHAQ